MSHIPHLPLINKLRYKFDLFMNLQCEYFYMSYGVENITGIVMYTVR